ncbi:hypothetical protein [Kitasatospora sp. NPDC087315]|uniref:hypothetical protein n=1 Tax=Kitasatospora sp. NPDC087315 TaxID=3364069 RepID=UPI00380EEACF
MVKNHARKNAARARAAATGESHQAAVAVVRALPGRPSLLPPPPTDAEILAEGRDTIAAALGELAQQAGDPQRRSMYLELQREVDASTTAADLTPERAELAYREADTFWMNRWNGFSASPIGSADNLDGISRCYWARRTIYEWLWPREWDTHLYGHGD